jgi:hypothetical protein
VWNARGAADIARIETALTALMGATAGGPSISRSRSSDLLGCDRPHFWSENLYDREVYARKLETLGFAPLWTSVMARDLPRCNTAVAVIVFDL